MSKRSVEFAELQELLSNLCDDRLDERCAARLNELLENDPQARAFSVDYLHAEASLHWDCVDIEAALTAGMQDDKHLLDQDSVGSDCASPTSPLLGFLGQGIGYVGTFMNRPTPFWMLISAIVLIPLASLFTVVIVSSIKYDRMVAAQNVSVQRDLRSSQAATSKAPKTTDGRQKPFAAAKSIAFLERQSDDARWASSENAAIMGIGLQSGHQLQLTHGLAEIAFESGAKVILQAPITLFLDEQNACSLEFGKLSAYVPPEATGFRVQSDEVTVIDLGTEFGMQVSGESDAEVHVFTGVVEAALTVHDDDPLIPAVESKPLRLEKNVALRIDPLTVTVSNQPPDPQQFVRKMPRSGVTDRPLIRNASFEFPPIDSSEESRNYFKPEYGNAWNLPIAGWEKMIVDGVPIQPAGYQLSPYISPEGDLYDVGPGATDGKQVAVLSLRKEGSVDGMVLENWIFQSLGEIVASDVGKTIELKADVAAREGQHENLGDGAKATLCFATDVTTKNPGTVIGHAGVNQQVLCADGAQPLTATLTVDKKMVGEKLFIRLSLANDAPKSGSEQYHFDNVRCRVLE